MVSCEVNEIMITCVQYCTLHELLTIELANMIYFFRYLLGRFTYFSMVFIPGILSGLSFIILTPTAKVKILATMCNTVSRLFTHNIYLNICIIYTYCNKLQIVMLLDFLIPSFYRHSNQSY